MDPTACASRALLSTPGSNPATFKNNFPCPIDSLCPACYNALNPHDNPVIYSQDTYKSTTLNVDVGGGTCFGLPRVLRPQRRAFLDDS